MLLQISYFALSLFGIIKRKSKILTPLMLIMMWIIFGFSTYNGDFGNYSWIYQNIQNPSYWTEFEPIFNVLMYVCSIVGLNFIQFRMVFGGLYIVLLYKTISKFTEFKAEVLGLYMLFPFLLFTSIIRSGFASLLILLAYHEIIAEKNNKVKFWVFIAIACLIQYTSIFFVFYYYLRKKEFRNKNIILVVGILVIAFASYYSGLMHFVVSHITSNYRVLKWFMPQASGQEIRWVLYLVIIDLMCLFLAYLCLRENRFYSVGNCNINPYAEDVFHINIAMLIFIPTFFVTNASSRFIWEMLLLNIICFVKDDELRFPVKRNKISFSRKMVVLIAFLLFFLFYSNLPYKGTENDINMLFRNNLIYQIDDFFMK